MVYVFCPTNECPQLYVSTNNAPQLPVTAFLQPSAFCLFQQTYAQGDPRQLQVLEKLGSC